LTMDEEYARSLRKWLEAEPSIPAQRGVADAGWDAIPGYPVVPLPRSTPETGER
jgi:hypothetical protein